MIDYLHAYQDNEDFKEYVDKYCTKHNKSVEDALEDMLVRHYYAYLQYMARDKK